MPESTEHEGKENDDRNLSVDADSIWRFNSESVSGSLVLKDNFSGVLDSQFNE
jgi:hypothetical protein